MKKLVLALVLLATPGCSTVSDFVGSYTHPAPNQAKTLAEAVQFAKIATDATDLAVTSGHFSTATLETIRHYNESVHAAIRALEDANAKGQALSFGAFNAAYAQFLAYATSQNIKVGG